jgi:electron transport complex protein RnfE
MNKLMTWLAPLSLVPLVGASLSLLQAIELTLATWLALVLHGVIMGACKRLVSPPLQLYASLLVAAAVVTSLDLTLQAWALNAWRDLGIYLPLIALQAVLLDIGNLSIKDRLASLALFSGLLLSLGLLREGLDRAGLHLATLAPAGFILLGLLIAALRFFFSSKDTSDQ